MFDISQTVPSFPPKPRPPIEQAVVAVQASAGWRTSRYECYGLERSHKRAILWLSIRVRRGPERCDNTDLVAVPVPSVESKARGRHCHCYEVLTREYGLW